MIDPGEGEILVGEDLVVTMASHRPYRPALGIDKALEEITRQQGTLYDPAVVAAWGRIFAEKGFKIS